MRSVEFANKVMKIANPYPCGSEDCLAIKPIESRKTLPQM